MPRTFPFHATSRPSWVARKISTPHRDHANDWLCSSCAKVLGVLRDGRLHLLFTRGHEYIVSFPVQAICRGCGTLNHKEKAR
jgi:hypothetical protein